MLLCYPLLNAWFTDIKYIYNVVQPSPPFVSINFSSSQTETCTHQTITSYYPLLPAPGDLYSTFHVLWICLFEVPHIDGRVQFLFFPIWLPSFSIMSSRFIHAAAWTCRSFFKAELHSVTFMRRQSLGPAPNHEPSAGGHVGCPHLGAIETNATLNIAVQVCVRVLAFSSFGIYLEAQLRGPMIILYLTSWGTLFHSSCTNFIFPPAMHQFLISPYPCQHLLFSIFLF